MKQAAFRYKRHAPRPEGPIERVRVVPRVILKREDYEDVIIDFFRVFGIRISYHPEGLGGEVNYVMPRPEPSGALQALMKEYGEAKIPDSDEEREELKELGRAYYELVEEYHSEYPAKRPWPSKISEVYLCFWDAFMNYARVTYK